MSLRLSLMTKTTLRVTGSLCFSRFAPSGLSATPTPPIVPTPLTRDSQTAGTLQAMQPVEGESQTVPSHADVVL